jgi:hypothetical protein
MGHPGRWSRPPPAEPQTSLFSVSNWLILAHPAAMAPGQDPFWMGKSVTSCATPGSRAPVTSLFSVPNRAISCHPGTSSHWKRLRVRTADGGRETVSARSPRRSPTRYSTILYSCSKGKSGCSKCGGLGPMRKWGRRGVAVSRDAERSASRGALGGARTESNGEPGCVSAGRSWKRQTLVAHSSPSRRSRDRARRCLVSRRLTPPASAPRPSGRACRANRPRTSRSPCRR